MCQFTSLLTEHFDHSYYYFITMVIIFCFINQLGKADSDAHLYLIMYFQGVKRVRTWQHNCQANCGKL